MEWLFNKNSFTLHLVWTLAVHFSIGFHFALAMSVDWIERYRTEINETIKGERELYVLGQDSIGFFFNNISLNLNYFR